MADDGDALSAVPVTPSTPPPIQPPLPARHVSKETPLKPRLTDSAAFRSENLEQRKSIIIRDLDGMVPEVEVEWFFKNVLPSPIPGFNVGTVVEELRKSEMITASGWKVFSDNPKDDSRHEYKVYGQLTSVFDAVIEATNSLYPVHTQHFALVMLPNRPLSSDRTSRTEPDATFLPTNIASDLNADEKNASYSCVDPRRRFSFGWTMQNRDLRMWFACRGAIFVTEAVDVFTNPDPLVRFFVFIAFSSRTALGWDPTIEVTRSPSRPRQYEITVNGRKFITVKNLADYSADSLVSRATRVWLVKDEEGKTFVLKDVWMDTNRLPEHEIRDNLLEDVLKKRGPDDHRKLSNHMLTPRVFERMKIDDMDDTTPRMMSEQTPTTSSVFHLVMPIPILDRTQSSHPSETSSQANWSETFRPVQIQMEGSAKLTIRSKYHYRIVFEEHGTDLYSEMDLHNVLKTLSDLVDALEIIHRSGWVHRDISCGNVYWLRDPVKGHRGILGDFEYAKRRDDQVEHEKRTGTSEFMAHEAAARRYQHMNIGAAVLAGIPLKDQATFAHNPLHDLESLWWILVYILLHRDNNNQLASNPQVRTDAAALLFHTDPRSFNRTNFIMQSWDINSSKTGVAPSFDPVLHIINKLGTMLIVTYEQAEAPYVEIPLERCMIHDSFRSYLTDRATINGIQGIQLTPVVRAPPNSCGKRKTPHDESDVPDKREPKKSKDC